MIKYLFLLMFSTSVFAYDMPIRYVYDGDTILLKEDKLPAPLSSVSVRVRGIDTPELRGKCDKEIQMAKSAKLQLQNLIGDAKVVTLKNMKWDRYGGRIDADAFIGDVNLGEEMLKSGLARPYDGKKRQGWCSP